jgi:MFS transporter, SP family, arabinose:H+ symporter
MKSQHYVLFLSLTAALGGFLFGFDTAVIAGAEREIQQLWGLSDWAHGLAVAMALYGTVIGALFGGYPADKWGRKRSLMGIGVLYLGSALGSALAPEVNSFMFFRFLGGLGVGASSVVAPMYISEIAPAGRRGQLVALYQFNIVFGILMAYLSNYLIGTAGWSSAWRWMLGVECLPALVYALLILKVPKSPRWLITKKSDYEAARKILEKTDPNGVDEAINLAKKVSLTLRDPGTPMTLFRRSFRHLTVFAFLIAFFNQLSGINAIIYFAPRIFEAAGITNEDALFSTIGIGIVNLLATLLGLYFIDKVGRKVLMYIGSVGYIFSLSMMAYSYMGGLIEQAWLPVFVYVFIASHAVGQGAVIWVFISEIFPNQLRAYGQSFGSFVHWFFAALLANVFPVVANVFGAGPIFGFFALMMVVQLVWVALRMPETKGKTLEQIQREMG